MKKAQRKIKINIEYEIPPLRAIYHQEYLTESEDEAVKTFKAEHPRGCIRKIKQGE